MEEKIARRRRILSSNFMKTVMKDFGFEYLKLEKRINKKRGRHILAFTVEGVTSHIPALTSTKSNLM